MRVRQPNLDFSGVRAHWTANVELAQHFNANSMVPAYIEPYLIKVMRRAKERLPPGDEELHRDLDVFIRQEAQHYKLHQAFNRALREDGYEGMLEYEKAYEADYERFLAKRSLRFNVAYCEGFEAIGAAGAKFWVEDAERVLRDADPRVVELWKWHLAEEYEHRTVCSRVFHALYGKGPTKGYVTRVLGFLYALRHIRGHTRRLTSYLLAKDREAMGPDEAQRSLEREQRFWKSRRPAERALVRAVVSPSYDPAAIPAPKGIDAFLAQY